MVSRTVRAYLLGLSFWLVSSIVALNLGSVKDAPFDLILEVRFPRVLLASVVGAGLSLAGAVLQVLFSNPLCEPYTLGISSGAALGAVLGLSLGLNWMIAGVAGSAFLGSVIFGGLLYLISFKSRRGSVTLLLGGVMLGFLGSSLVALWLALSDSNGIQSAIAWLFGDLSRSRLQGALFSVGTVAGLGVWIWSHGQKLDALLLGEEGAAAVGIDVPSLRRKMVLLISLLVGLCVSAGGMIGFVGLMVPHFARKWVGSLHCSLLPLCAIWGASILTTADCLSRTLVSPYELPVGVVTAILGSPCFVWIMYKRQEIQ